MGHADLGSKLRRFFSRAPRGAAPARPVAARRAIFEEVEARILFSADIAPGIVDGAAAAEVRIVDSAPEAAPVDQTTSAQTSNVVQQSTQLVFVDTSVDHWQDLLADASQTHPDAEIITLDTSRDGIAQITDVLSQRTNVSAIHLITHGASGALQIGNANLDALTIGQYADAIGTWRNALTDNADILIYGCDFAANDVGKQLSQDLSALTGADVAASEDLTGNAALGGNWNLEYATGTIETNVVIDTAAQANWNSTLAITQDAVSNGATSSLGASSLTVAHTVGTGANAILIVEYSTRGTTSPTSITYNGVALTQLSAISNGTVVTSEIWYLKAPTTGTHNIVVTLATPHEFTIGATSFFNVNLTTTFGTPTTGTGTSTSPSIAVASATGNLVIDTIATRQQSGAPTVGAGQTQLWTNNSGTASADELGAGSTEAGAASVTMSWTLTDSMEWASIGVSLTAAPNVAPVVSNTAAALAYTENAAATAVDSAMTVTDADNTNLTGATVQITGNYSSLQDVLSFTNQLGIPAPGIRAQAP